MAILTLKDRIQSYESLSDTRLMKGLPIIITLNGRAFKRTTSLLTKPFSDEFLLMMKSIIIKLMNEIDGSIFAYSFSDEIVLAARNEQSMQSWYDGRVQKIASAVSAIATFEFAKIANTNNINVLGDPIFTSTVFSVPTISEAINVLVAKQQQAFHKALYEACYYNLINKHDLETVRQSIDNKTAQEKADILFEDCGIDYNGYDIAFRRGVATFRAPKVISLNGLQEIRNKLIVDCELPIFSKEAGFLDGIFRAGKDIVR